MGDSHPIKTGSAMNLRICRRLHHLAFLGILAILTPLSGCGFFSGKYPIQDPKELGDKVNTLLPAVYEGVGGDRVAQKGGPVGGTCGEDWHEKKTVTPLPNDPWKVTDSPYRITAAAARTFESGSDTIPVYIELYQHLKRAGWNLGQEPSQTSATVVGEKDGISFDAYHFPDGHGKIIMTARLESDCYRHPNG